MTQQQKAKQNIAAIFAALGATPEPFWRELVETGDFAATAYADRTMTHFTATVSCTGSFAEIIASHGAGDPVVIYSYSAEEFDSVTVLQGRASEPLSQREAEARDYGTAEPVPNDPKVLEIRVDDRIVFRDSVTGFNWYPFPHQRDNMERWTTPIRRRPSGE